eukprot:EG_transcript_52080
MKIDSQAPNIRDPTHAQSRGVIAELWMIWGTLAERPHLCSGFAAEAAVPPTSGRPEINPQNRTDPQADQGYFCSPYCCRPRWRGVVDPPRWGCPARFPQLQ